VTNSTLTTPPRRKRPLSVTFFALAVLYLGVVNLARAWLALNGSSFERTLALAMPLPYLGVGGLTWGIVFILVSFGIWRVWPGARKVLLGAIVVYQCHIWINHFVFDTSVYSRQVWPFEAGISLVWIIVVWGFLFLPGIKRLYSRTREAT
jgi:hypothetical protein